MVRKWDNQRSAPADGGVQAPFLHHLLIVRPYVKRELENSSA